VSAPADILLRITARRRERLAEFWDQGDQGDRGNRDTALVAAGPLAPEDNAFLGALAARRAAGKPAVIAEVKMGSPRLGSLASRLDPEAQARAYAENGAAALSVVVEPDFFHGGYDLLARCRRASGLPAIAKDFVVDPVQLRWAKEAGADAVLLIAALLDAEDLRRYAGLARGLGLVPLIETHSAEDVAKLADSPGKTPWEIVGVNNRDLRTFQVDLAASLARLPELPAGAIKVAESGIDGRDAVSRLHQGGAGFDAFLVGESLLLAENPGEKLRELAQW
jgi:indole-3-glycerol phosphate synthase